MDRMIGWIWRQQGRRGRGARGQSLTEFALVLPVALLVMLLAADFGRLFMGWVTLDNAARIAANYGSTNPNAFTGTGIAAQQAAYEQAVLRETSGMDCALQPSATQAPYPTYPDGTNLGDPAVVNLSCDFSLLTPFIANILGSNTVHLSSSAQFPIRTGGLANVGSGTITVPLPGSPIAAFTAFPTSGTAPLVVTVSNQSVNAQTWDWNWGDGTTDDTTQTPPAHTYSSAGTYTITLTVTNPSGTSQATTLITVSDTPEGPPQAGFYGTVVPPYGSYYTGGGSTGAAAIQGTYPLIVSFTNTSTNTAGATYLWKFGDGATDTTAQPQHTYSSLGAYTVSLTVTTASGSNTTTMLTYVTTGCQVPNFANTSSDNTQTTWSTFNWTGAVSYWTGNGKSYSKTAPNPAYTILSQSLTGGLFYPNQCGLSIQVANAAPLP